MAVDGRRRVVLLACGSFNPITDQHLRLFGERIGRFKCYNLTKKLRLLKSF